MLYTDLSYDTEMKLEEFFSGPPRWRLLSPNFIQKIQYVYRNARYVVHKYHTLEKELQVSKERECQLEHNINCYKILIKNMKEQLDPYVSQDSVEPCGCK